MTEGWLCPGASGTRRGNETAGGGTEFGNGTAGGGAEFENETGASRLDRWTGRLARRRHVLGTGTWLQVDRES